MCSIFGAYARSGTVHQGLFEEIRKLAKDRGRDGGNTKEYVVAKRKQAILGNWRATPTTETEAAPSQPYGNIVHNGTIANDRELGNAIGNVDSMILPSVIDTQSAITVARSLDKVKGSYALGIVGEETVYLATNYKPIYFMEREGVIYFSSMERHLEPVCSFGQRPQRVEPYTVLDLETEASLELPRERNRNALVVCSAGLDSTTVAYWLRHQGFDVALLHFEYGCKAETKESKLIEDIAKHMGVECIKLPLDYSQFRGQSPLLNDTEIASGVEGAEFAHEWVPARNLVMLAHATAYAEANGFGYIALGNNLEESGAYPDNEEEFTHRFDQLLDYAVHDGGMVRVLSPVGNLMKHEIVNVGKQLGVPYELTWSCYKDGEEHCGECGPCFMRNEAFERDRQRPSRVSL